MHQDIETIVPLGGRARHPPVKWLQWNGSFDNNVIGIAINLVSTAIV
jgi:hypothetical protein